MLAIARLMVMMHHNLWYIIGVTGVGIAALLLGSQIHHSITRIVVIGIGIVVMAFVLTTGAIVGPLDNWQHQHGSCLLENLQKEKKP